VTTYKPPHILFAVSPPADIFVVSYSGQVTSATGCVAAHVEEKSEKYFHLAPNYLFQPAMETSGVIGATSLSF